MVERVPDVIDSSTTRPAVALEEARPVDFLGAFLFLLDRKWIVIAVAILCGAIGGAYALLATPWFRAEVVMMPAEQGSPLSGLGQIGGLASLAGIDLGGGGGEKYLAALRSRSFATDFIESKSLVPVLLADDWDGNADNQPDIRKAVEYFDDKVRTIGDDKRTGTVTVAVQWKDPVVAAEWANEISTMINARLRKQALEESERNVRYLQQEIAAANIASLQQSMGRVLESEMQKLMMARGTDEYAFKIIDKAVPPRKRFRPQRTLLIVMSTIAGAILCTGFLLLQRTLVASVRQRSRRESPLR